VVDIRRERLNLAREVVGERCVLGTDYVRLVQSVRPDGVIISTPNDLHAPMTTACLDLGAHVLCEKPLAVRADLAERCVAHARRRGLRLKVGSNHRFWRGVRETLDLVESGTIGGITRIEGEIGYRLPDVRSDWYREKERSGGGTIIDNCPHLIDVVEQILRLSGGDRIARVRCATSRDVFGLEVEDQARGTMVSARGTAIEMAATWADGDYRMKLHVQGEHGRIVLSGFEPLIVETADGVVRRDLSDAPASESWELDVDDFARAVLRGSEPWGSGADGLRSVRVIDALYESARRGSDEVPV
jgi:predicted dehydrogenase